MAERGAYWESKALLILEREFRAFCTERNVVPTPTSVDSFAIRCTGNGTRNCLGFTRAEIVSRLEAANTPYGSSSS